jgi:hypothetical protein
MPLFATNLALAIHQPLTDDLVSAVRELATERNADYALLRDGLRCMVLMRKPGGRLSFNSGMDTLRKKLLGGPVERVDLPKNPLSYFRNHWPDGLPPDAVVAYAGDSFSPDAIRASYTGTERMIDPDVPLVDLVRRGDITMSEVASISCGRAALKQEQIDLEHKSKPDLDGPLILTFGKHVNGKMVGKPIPVTIIGRPNDALTKRKHYWIYSSAGYGKSTTVDIELEDKFNAASLQHAQNAVNIPSTAQFLILDECQDTNRIPIAQLKGLTGGKASKSYLNRKSFGQSYVPRADAQFIIMSNFSPYEVYANKKTGRLNATDMAALEERFNIIRLDGRNEDERSMYGDVRALSAYELREAMYAVLYDAYSFLNKHKLLKKTHVRDALVKCYTMYKNSREHSKRVVSTDTFLMYLQSLLHDDDVAVYERVHKDYALTKEYGFNAIDVGETIVIVPVMQRPDWHVAPSEDDGLNSAASPNSDDMSHMLSTRLRTTQDISPTITCRPPPVPSTHWVDEPQSEPNDDEMDAMMELHENFDF